MVNPVLHPGLVTGLQVARLTVWRFRGGYIEPLGIVWELLGRLASHPYTDPERFLGSYLEPGRRCC
jgi:hypothetical protein